MSTERVSVNYVHRGGYTALALSPDGRRVTSVLYASDYQAYALTTDMLIPEEEIVVGAHGT